MVKRKRNLEKMSGRCCAGWWIRVPYTYFL